MDNTYIIHDRIYNNKDYKILKKSNKRNKDNTIRNIRGDLMETTKKIQRDLRYKDKGWLEVQYLKLKKSTSQISNNCKVSMPTISFWLKKFNIQMRSRSERAKVRFKTNKKKYSNKDWLYNQYTILKRSTTQIAKECNVNRITILRWLDIFKIRKRINSEAKKNWYNQGNEVWNKEKHLNEKHRKNISKANKGKNLGEKNWRWKGGHIDKRGYKLIRKPCHPNCNSNGYITEHRFIMSKKLKRILQSEEIVHHIDGNKLNNKIENLFLCKNKGKHQKIEAQLKKTIHELIQSQKFGKVIFNKEKGKYFIEFLEEIK